MIVIRLRCHDLNALILTLNAKVVSQSLKVFKSSGPETILNHAKVEIE